MTDDEWSSICFLMENAWKGELDEDKRDAYRVFLHRFESGEVMAALHQLAEEGKPFLPAVPEIVGSIRKAQEPELPAWSEVKNAIWKSFRKDDERAALDYLDGIHPFIAAFVQVEGWKTLRMTPFEDIDYGALRIKDLKERWEDFCEVGIQRVKRGRALHAITGRSDAGPRRLDGSAVVAGLLPPERRQIEQKASD